MSRKNNNAKHQRHLEYGRKDEAERIAKNKKRNDARKKTADLRARGIDPLKQRKNAAKKAKVAPVVDAESKKMQKMMKSMNLAGAQKGDNSSDWESDKSENDMEVDHTTVTKLIKKKKPLPRSYYQALKKSARRQAKAAGCAGMKLEIDKLDDIIAELQM